MRGILIALAAAFAAALLVPAALADGPTKEPLINVDFTDTTSCAFPVDVHILMSKEFVKTFSDGRTLINGALKVSVTNASNPSKSLDLNVSGPATITVNPDGTVVFEARGRGFGPVDGTLKVIAGRVFVSLVPPGPTTQLTGHAVDLCAALA